MENISEDIKNQFETGDLILFHTTSKTSWFGQFVQFFTASPYSHVGMILRDPKFTDKKLVGLFFWESSRENYPDVEDNKKKFGVEIVSLDRLIQGTGAMNLYYRKLNLKNGKKIDEDRLNVIHSVVHNKPYDTVPRDWIEAFFKIDSHPQKTDRFWCSALVGFIYTKLGLMAEDTDWSILRPDFFSDQGKCELIDAELGPQIKLK